MKHKVYWFRDFLLTALHPSLQKAECKASHCPERPAVLLLRFPPAQSLQASASLLKKVLGKAHGLLKHPKKNADRSTKRQYATRRLSLMSAVDLGRSQHHVCLGTARFDPAKRNKSAAGYPKPATPGFLLSFSESCLVSFSLSAAAVSQNK